MTFAEKKTTYACKNHELRQHFHVFDGHQNEDMDHMKLLSGMEDLEMEME